MIYFCWVHNIFSELENILINNLYYNRSYFYYLFPELDKIEPEIQNTRSRSKDEGRTKKDTATPERKTQKNEMREKTKKIEQDTEKRRGRKRRDTDPADKTER